MKFSFSAALLGAGVVSAQLSGSVGPTTTTAQKAAKKTCNILDYGGSASVSSDNSAAINSAWAACKSGGEIYIPAGDYGLSTWVSLSGGTGVSIRLDGIIHRTGTAGGNMIFVEHTTDFEFFSSTSAGAIQGDGYIMHRAGTTGPRLLRFYEVTDFSVHDIALVDAPVFHFTMDTCTNGEVYNTIVRGGNSGGLDGIDIWGTNIWVHDVEVSNRDECVTVKSPASYIQVENVFCNWSGGCAIGSLSTGTDIHHISYNNIYTVNSNQMFMIKSNGGSGSLYSSSFTNFMGHANAYTLDINAYWSSQSVGSGDGVLYHDLTFSGWKGTCSNGVTRGPVQVVCPSDVPCYNINISDVDIWTEAGSSVLYKCENAYGTGACLKSGSNYAAYAITTQTVQSVANYAITTMPGELSSLPLTETISIPAIPTSFYPNVPAISAKLG